MLSEEQRVDYYMGKTTKTYNTYKVSKELVPKEKTDCKKDIINVINWKNHLSTTRFDNGDYWFKDFTRREGKIPLWDKIGTGYVYSSKHVNRENAKKKH